MHSRYAGKLTGLWTVRRVLPMRMSGETNKAIHGRDPRSRLTVDSK
jgi:hypothetical protein